MIEIPYHDDADRLFYNTGNRTNTEKRTRSKLCGSNSCDLSDAPVGSLQERFKYFKRKNPPPNLANLRSPQFYDVANFDDTIDSWMIDKSQMKILRTKSGLIICKRIFSKSLLDILAKKSLYCFTTLNDGRNNLKNIGLTIEDKLDNWKECPTKHLKKDPLKELRWVTLGRHHNWLETVPGDENSAGQIPEILQELGAVIGKLLKFENIFKTEASIINYYPANTSTIGIHRDDLDYQVAPIMTISLGCPGLFLLGAGERLEPCFEIILEHGDLCILDGSDRSAFHAVPRVFDFDTIKVNPNYPPIDDLLESGDEAVDSYLRQSRINISLRQITKS